MNKIVIFDTNQNNWIHIYAGNVTSSQLGHQYINIHVSVSLCKNWEVKANSLHAWNTFGTKKLQFENTFSKFRRCQVQTMSKTFQNFSQSFDIQIFIAIFGIQHEKHIKTSTNKPSIGAVVMSTFIYS